MSEKILKLVPLPLWREFHSLKEHMDKQWMKSKFELEPWNLHKQLSSYLKAKDAKSEILSKIRYLKDFQIQITGQPFKYFVQQKSLRYLLILHSVTWVNAFQSSKWDPLGEVTSASSVCSTTYICYSPGTLLLPLSISCCCFSRNMPEFLSAFPTSFMAWTTDITSSICLTPFYWKAPYHHLGMFFLTLLAFFLELLS